MDSFSKLHALLFVCHLASTSSDLKSTGNPPTLSEVSDNPENDLRTTSSSNDVTRMNKSGLAGAPVAYLKVTLEPSMATSNPSSGLDSPECQTDCCGGKSINFTEQSSIENLRSNFQFICQGILLPVIAIPGCICNVINIYVLTREAKFSANTRFLVGLSIADLTYLIFSLIGWIEYLLQVFNYRGYVLIVTGMRIYWNRSFASLVTGRMSNLIILLLSLERFLVVKFPFRAKDYCLSKHPIKILVGLFIFVSAVFLPNIFRREYTKVFDPVLNETSAVVTRSQFDLNNQTFLLIHTYFLLVCLRLVPVFLVVVLNLAIVVILRSSRFSLGTNQSSEDKRRANELKVTRMLLVISFLFFICITPALIHTLLGNGLPGYNFFGSNSQLFKIFFYIYPIFDVLNSTINFIVYVFMSDNFRGTFINMFRRKAKAQRTFTKGTHLPPS